MEKKELVELLVSLSPETLADALEGIGAEQQDALTEALEARGAQWGTVVVRKRRLTAADVRSIVADACERASRTHLQLGSHSVLSLLATELRKRE